MVIGYGYRAWSHPAWWALSIRVAFSSTRSWLGWNLPCPRGGDPTDPTKKEETQDAGLTPRQSQNTGKWTTRSLTMEPAESTSLPPGEQLLSTKRPVHSVRMIKYYGGPGPALRLNDCLVRWEIMLFVRMHLRHLVKVWWLYAPFAVFEACLLSKVWWLFRFRLMLCSCAWSQKSLGVWSRKFNVK